LHPNKYCMPARFFENEVNSQLKDKRALSAFLDGLIHTYKKDVKKASLSFIFCTDDFLLSINREYLQHNTLTDIITFDMSEKAHTLQGEIYISTQRVLENAEKFSVPYLHELHRVIFHGVLHLCGYKDKTEQDQKKMRQMENKCLKEYFNQVQA